MKKIFLSALIFLFLCGCTTNAPYVNHITENGITSDEATLVSITDKSKDTPDLAFAEALEQIFEDDENVYYLPCIMSEYIVAEYSDGTKESIKSALSSEKAKISDLDRFGVFYITESKEHTHTESEKNNMVEHEVFGYCGNTMTTVRCHGFAKGQEDWEYSFWGGVSVGISDFLRRLDYSEEVCKCLPEYTVDTEFGLNYGINLSEGYVRHEGKQVSLTKEQTEYLKGEIEKVYDGYKNDKIPGSNL
ncbi:MAG: hypothetical protein E7656_07975 [Ruminococcaceae bacterium]|nr:hypothetical protein [Oscillospiraceae bacterium]